MNFTQKLSIFLLLLSSFVLISGQETADLNTNDRVTIYSISTNIDYLNYNQQGSVNGGTWLYIKAIGLDQTASNNEVKIADYPCIVPEKGVNQFFITCETVPALNPLQQINLPVRIFVRNKKVSVCGPYVNCAFTYNEDVTPILSLISPKAAAPKTFTNWLAVYRIYNTADIKKMNIGDSLCHRFEQDSFTVLNDDTVLDPNTWSYVPCKVADDMSSGLYDVTLRTRAGFPRQYSYTAQLTADGLRSYQFAVVPQVTSVSSNVGSLYGQDLEISGDGFSELPSNNTVTAGSLPCTVTESTKHSIKCTVSAGSSSTGQSAPFVSGAGFKSTLYNLASQGVYNSAQFRQKMIDTPSALQSQVLSSGLTYELEAKEMPEYSGYFVSGFFKAPRAGNYRFYAAADDSIDVYISTTANVVNRASMTRVAYNCEWNLFRNYDNGKSTCDKGVSDYYALEEGKLYYMEVFSYNGGSAGYYTVSVEVPNPDTVNTAINSVPEVQYFNMTYTPDYEKYSIKVWNFNASFQFQLFYRNPVSRVVQWDRTTPAKTWSQWTAAEVRNYLDWAANYYSTVVESFDLDGSGQRLASGSTAAAQGREWVVTFQRYRDGVMNMAPQIYQNTIPSSSFSITKIQSPSPPITGTYRLFYDQSIPIKVSVNGQWTADIPYNYDCGNIVLGLRRALGFFQFDCYQLGWTYDGIKFYVQFLGQRGSHPLLTADASGLNGGQANTKPFIEVTRIRAGSTNFLYEPIPFDMLVSYSSLFPQITVQSNGILGGCTSNCSYITNADYTSVLKSFSHTATGLTLSVQKPDSLIISNTNLRIFYAGLQCTSIDASILTAVTCSLSTVAPGGAIMVEAGLNQAPIVHIANAGYASLEDAGLVKITTQVVVSSVTPAIGSIQGGITVTLAGSGFPSASANIAKISVKVGNAQVAKIVSSSYSQLVFVLPKIAVADAALENQAIDVIVQYNGVSSAVSATTKFTYTRTGIPTLSAVSPKSASPVLKTPIVITGTGFGTDKTKLRVFLDDASTNEEKYELGVVSCTDTTINAILGGGHVGSLNVRVVLQDKGFSIPDSASAALFKYEIKVTSVTPNTGSLLGGTELTIIGENFSGVNKNDNNVFVSYDALQMHINVMCTVTSATTTQIKCTTGPSDVEGPPAGTKMKVIVQGRLIEDATCDTDTVCHFTYSNDDTPTMVQPQLADSFYYVNGQTYYVNGSKFTSTDVKVLFTHPSLPDFVSVAANGINDTHISFQFPSLPALPTDTDQPASYTAILYIGNKGYAGVFNTKVFFGVTGISAIEGSKGGQDFTISGSGFSKTLGVTVPNCLVYNVVSPTQITARLNPQSALTAVKISVVQAGATATCSNAALCTFTPTAAKTPLVTARVPDTGVAITTPTTFSILLTGSNFNTFTTQTLSAFLQLASNPTVKFNAASVTRQTTNTQFNVAFTNVPAGTYLLFVLVSDGIGYVSFASTTIQTFVVSLGTLSVNSNNVRTSYAGGGTLTISSSTGGFNTVDLNANHISVCGYGCAVTSATSSQVKCSIPPIRTQFLSDQLQTSLLNKQYMYANLGSVTTKGPNSQKSITMMSMYSNSKIIQDQPIELNEFDLFGNKFSQLGYIMDNLAGTFYDTSPADAVCYIGFDFGFNFKAQLTKVTYQPRADLKSTVYKEFAGTKFQGSNDNTTWTDIFVLGTKVSKNSDYWLSPTTGPAVQYRYFRFTHDGTNSKVLSGKGLCQWAEIKLYGYYNYKDEIASLDTGITCDAQYELFGNTAPILTGAVTYTNLLTPLVTGISPRFGKVTGGTVVTIVGAGFGIDKTIVQVLLSGVPCSISTITNTQIVCTTGSTVNENQQFQSVKVIVNSFDAAVSSNLFFYHGLRWTDSETWGGEVAPRAGDSVYVPKDQTLIIDQSSPVFLKAVIVEGNLIFADEADMTFDAEFIVIRGGKFIIGSEDSPYQHKLVITMHGDYSGQQLPEFGNKVIGCHHCTLDIHGSPKTPTWTELASTADVGATSITLTQSVNWAVGDTIVIASTNFDHNEAETRVITAITNSAKTLAFAEPLVNKHVSVVETYTKWDGTSVNVPMKAEVAVLTRNVVIRGDENSEQYMYGAHLMIHGHSEHGSIGRIEQTEFFWTGQPRILGRYTIHFHMNGECRNSYVRGNAVHDSFARVVTIHAVSYLRVQQNVGFRATGHNIFLEDGIEMHNIIEDNLLISSLQASFMLQTDITVASIWITNPSNIVRRNRCAGSDFYGMWYEIREHPEGPSATDDICQQGFPLEEYTENQAHSNVRFGLRIFVISSRQKPCLPWRNDGLVDPWSENPSIQQIYSNFLTYKNMECGVLAEHMGNSIFRNFTILDSFRAGFQIHRSNYTKEDVVLEDAIIVGRSQGNANSLDFHLNSKGIITSRTDGFAVRKIAFHNFGAGMILVEGGSENFQVKLWVQGGKQFARLSQITQTNCQDAKVIRWQGGNKANIILDEDGTLTQTGKKTYLTSYKKHFQDVTECVRNNTVYYDDSVLCQDVELRGYLLRNLVPLDNFKSIYMKSFNLNNKNGNEINTKGVSEELFEWNFMWKIKNPAQDAAYSYAVVYPTNYTFNVHFKEGIDWQHMLIVPSIHAAETDKTTILRFNFTEPRELFEIKKMLTGKLVGDYPQKTDLSLFINNSTKKPNNDGCRFGDYFVDQTKKHLYVCINGKDKASPFDSVDLNAIYCRDTCPTAGFQCTKETIVRFWNNDTQWNEWPLRRPKGSKWDAPYQTGVPGINDDVLIPCAWTMKLNDPVITVNSLTIDGTVRFDEGLPSIKLSANFIWVRGGKLAAGLDTNPFQGKLEIALSGGFEDSDFVIMDDISRPGNKVLAVTGVLELYGKSPATKWTRLASKASPNSDTITVVSADGWAVGDEIVIGPTNVLDSESEKRKITAISGTTITLNETIKFFHYGAATPTVATSNAEINTGSNFGTNVLDMRATVGHITRNIKVYGTGDDNWGGHIFVYHWIDDKKTPPISARGSILLDGVELSNMGKRDIEKGGIFFFMTNTDGLTSVVKNSAFHDTAGQSLHAEYASHVVLDNNVFFNAIKYHLFSEFHSDWTVSNNLFMRLHQRELFNENITGNPDIIAAVYMLSPYNVDKDNIKVFSNVVQGSESTGYVIADVPCASKDKNAFYDNEAGVCEEVGFIIENQVDKTGRSCAGRLSAYHAQRCVMFNANSRLGSLLEKARLAECGLGITQRLGTDSQRLIDGYLNDVWIGSAIRDWCPECYAGKYNQYCQGTQGYQMQASSHSTKVMQTGVLGYDNICVPQWLHSVQFVNNVEFYNFKVDFMPPLENVCGDNSAFVTQFKASDATAGHYLRGTKCTNCDKNALFKFLNPSDLWRGWFGGCGEMDCTGPKNVLAVDFDGTFLGRKGSAISNTQYIGPGLSSICTVNYYWNGYDCVGTEFGIVEWESVAWDRQRQMAAPVYLANKFFTNKINAWREWAWQGSEPLNQRFMRFNSIVQLNMVYNLTYQGTNPYDQVHKIQHRTIPSGETNKYVIYQQIYPVPLSVQVLVNDKIIKPFIKEDNITLNTTDGGKYLTCGSNNYFFRERFVEYVITSHTSCIVQVRLINSVQVSTRLAMTAEAFFDDNSRTNFVDRIASFLQISTDRLKIVGIRKVTRRLLTGSEPAEVDVDFFVEDDKPIASQSEGYNPQDQFLKLQDIGQKVQDGLKNNIIEVGATVVSAEVTISVAKDTSGNANSIFTEKDLVKPSDTQSDDDSNKTVIIVCAVIFGFIGLMIIAGLVYYILKHKAQAPESNTANQQYDQIGQNKDFEKQTIAPKPVLDDPAQTEGGLQQNKEYNPVSAEGRDEHAFSQNPLKRDPNMKQPQQEEYAQIQESPLTVHKKK